MLNIQGKLLNDPNCPHLTYYASRKLSSFIKELQVIFDIPNYQKIFWRRQSGNNQDIDSFQIKRQGNIPINCKVILKLLQNPLRFKISEQLQRIVGMKTATRVEILQGVY